MKVKAKMRMGTRLFRKVSRKDQSDAMWSSMKVLFSAELAPIHSIPADSKFSECSRKSPGKRYGILDTLGHNDVG